MKDAREKAQLLSKELGQSIGKAHAIEEVDVRSNDWYSPVYKTIPGNETTLNEYL